MRETLFKWIRFSSFTFQVSHHWCGSDDIWVSFRLCSARIDLYHIYSRVLRVCVRACATTVKKTVSAFCSSSRSFHA